LAPLVFIVAGLFGGVVGQRSIDQLRERIGQSLAVDAQRIADRLNQEMADRSRDLALLGALDPMRNLHDMGAVQALLDSFRRSEPIFLWLAVTDVAGNAVAATDGALVGNDLNSFADLRDQLRGRPNSQGDPLRIVRPGDTEQPPIERQRQINISRPIRAADSSAVGVIVAQLSWDWVRENVRALLTPVEDGGRHRQAIIVSSYDTVLVGPPEMVGRRLVLPEISRARVGIFGWSTDNGYITGVNFAAGDRQYAGPGSMPMRWTVLVREDEDTAFAPARQLRLAILVTGTLLSLTIALLGWAIAGLITRPLRQIAAAADCLRRGEDVELPILKGATEVEILSASLRAMVATLSSKQVKLDELESATQHDPLTGLLNRAGLQSWLSRAVAQARTEPSGLLVLVGDLDGFKQVNDTQGHAAGDDLLREVGRRLQSSVRSRDAVARIGGDEFVVVLHAPLGLGDRLALETGHRLWSRVTESYVIGGELITIGLSLGGAGWPEDDRHLDVVLNKADAALYAAKRAGKGRIVFHREPALG
jgi:diguanylate cyclase (GGDEF)-like protein